MPSDSAVFSLRGAPYKHTKYGAEALDLRQRVQKTKRQPSPMATTLQKAPAGKPGLHLRGTILVRPAPSDTPAPFAKKRGKPGG